MKRIIILLVAGLLVFCVETKAQKSKPKSKKEQQEQLDKMYGRHIDMDSLEKTMAFVDIKFICPQLKGQLPRLATLNVDPVDLFKKKGINTSKATLDSIAKCWNEIINRNSQLVHDMYPKGTSFNGDNAGKCWIATTAVVKDNEIYIWTQESEYIIGKHNKVVLDTKNRLKL